MLTALAVSALDLWLPILISAVVVFIASSIAWTVLPHHKGDWQSLKDKEPAVLGAVRSADLPPGQYMMPYMEGMKGEDAKQKMEGGCMACLIVFPTPTSMGRNLALTFVTFLVVSALVAHVAALALPAGTQYMTVFHLVAVTAFLAHYTGGVCHGVWFGRPTRQFLTDLADALVYALLTAGIFGWLWPKAAAIIDPAAAGVPGF